MKPFHLRLLALLLLASPAAWGQGGFGGRSRVLGQNADTTNDPPFVASLVLIKADWSKSPAAKEIESELRQALEGASIPQELLDKLPSSSAQVLFPRGIAAFYTGEHYAQLLAWLKSKELVIETIPFRTDQAFNLDVPGTKDETRPKDPVRHAATLIKSYGFLDLPSMNLGDSPPFVSREPAFLWSVRAIDFFGDLTIERRLVTSVTTRGNVQPDIERVNDEWTVWTARTDGQVAVINSFPEPIMHAAAVRKGFEALIVVNRRAAVPAGEVQPRLLLPDEVEVLPPRTKLDYTFGEAAAESAPDESIIKVFSLRHAKATDAERIINQLFARSIESIAADERSNSLIVRGSAGDLNVIFHLLIRLDEQLQSSDKPQTAETWPNPAPSASLAELTTQFEAQEREAQELARQLRDLPINPTHKSSRDKLTADLQGVVKQAFALRQRLHEAELAQLQRRVAGIQQNLKSRAALSDQIIERRVKDLVSPDLKWESSSRSPGVAASAAPSGEVPSGRRDLQAEGTGTAPRPKVRVGAFFREEADEVWAALGLKVQPLTKDEAPEPKYAGALKIIEIAADSAAGELKVGDIIIAITTYGGVGNVRRAEIMILRGDERVSVTVQFPSSTLSPPAATREPAATSTASGPALPVIAGQTTILRPAEEFAERLRTAEAVLSTLKGGTVRGLGPSDPDERAKLLAHQTSEAQRKLDFARDEYNTQLRLLELEKNDAALAVELAANERQESEERFKSGREPRSRFTDAERAAQAANLRFQRAQALLELYRKADPKQTASGEAVTDPTAKPR